MPLLTELTVIALLLPTAITPPAGLAYAMAPEGAPIGPTAVASPSVVVPAGATVIVTEGAPTDVVAATTTTTATTTATTTTTTTTTIATAPVVAAPAVLSPKVAVRNLLRYDPYLAPRYRSGRNMMIGGGIAMGLGTFTLLSTLSWLSLSREASRRAALQDTGGHDARMHNQWVPTVRIIGLVAAVVAVSGVVLLATGAVRRRRAIEEARGRVYMQAGPGGMQVRF